MPLTMEHILKQGPKRTVLLEAPDPAEPRVGRVIKRFHAGGLLGGLMDRQRARREFQALKNVRKLGIAAPKPIEVRKGKARWDLVTEEIPGARDLGQVFANAQLADQPALSLRLATDLAKFLQQLLMGGVQHGDLHPGNVVLDENQQPWLVDMRNVRTGVPNRERDFLDLLLHLCQGCRETTPARWRAVFLARLRRSCVGTSCASWFQDLNPSAIESSARGLRRSKGRKRIPRWQRESSAATRRKSGWVALKRKPGNWRRHPAVSMERALIHWNALGHLAEHQVPAEQPVLLWVGTRGVRVVSGLPKGTRPMSHGSDASPQAWGHILGTIADRGLYAKTDSMDRWWLTPEGQVLAGDVELQDLVLQGPATPWGFDDKTVGSDWSDRQHEDFLLAWCQAHGGGSTEQRALRESMLGQF